MTDRAGTLVLLVGPSGAGKDTLLAGARSALADDARFVFARRIVTRAHGDDIEKHDALEASAFHAAENAGEFFLSWHAHGTSYAIPAKFRDDLARGHVVVANVSRTVIGRACQLAAGVAVIHVTASRDVLAARLAARDREDAQAIAARLDREVAITFAGGPLIEIVNDGAADNGVRSLTQTLLAMAGCQTVARAG